MRDVHKRLAEQARYWAEYHRQLSVRLYRVREESYKRYYDEVNADQRRNLCWQVNYVTLA